MKKIKSRKLRKEKQKFLRWWCLIIIIVSIGYCGNVSAGMNDSLLEKNRIEDVYAIALVNGETRIFYLNMYEMNGRISYCIDLGVDIITDIYHSTNDFLANKLSDEQINYIRKVSYYGYGFEGHEDYRYYMASQELIWEYLGNTLVEWSNEMKKDGNRIDIEDYKEEILNWVNYEELGVDLDWQDGQVYKVGDKIVLTDNNSVIKYYDVVSSKYSEVSIEEDNFVINVGNNIGHEKIELKRIGYYDYDSLLYYYDNSQRLISNGNYRGIDEILEFDVEGLTLNVQVFDYNLNMAIPRGEASLAGAVYEIYEENGDLVGEYITDEKGKFKVDNLLLGKYYIIQKTASEGYLINNKKINFEINKDNDSLILYQKVIDADININKVYGSNGNYKPEKLVSFIIYNNKGNLCSHVTTNNEGYIGLNLAYGTYKVVQQTTTLGYSKVDDFFIEIKKPIAGKLVYNLVNELILAKVRVSTKDIVTYSNVELEGFSYRIRKRDENTYLEVNGKDVFTTDKNGELLIPVMLEYGDYVLEQVSVPKGVVLNKKNLSFSINNNSNLILIDGTFVMDINFYNEVVMGKVLVRATKETFYKEHNDYGYVLESRDGSLFSLVANEDIIVNNKVVYESGDEIYTGITDELGSLVIDNLYLGSYCLIDKDINEDTCFVLESIDDKVKVVEKSVEFISLSIKQ